MSACIDGTIAIIKPSKYQDNTLAEIQISGVQKITTKLHLGKMVPQCVISSNAKVEGGRSLLNFIRSIICLNTWIKYH